LSVHEALSMAVFATFAIAIHAARAMYRQMVGRCRLTLSNPRRKRLKLSASNQIMMNYCFQVLL
jgi:hypothetical protein